MKIILNAIQYQKNSTGIGYMAYYWFSNVVKIKKADDLIDVVLSKDSPLIWRDKIEGIKEIRSPFNKNQVIRRNIYELFPPGGIGKEPGVFVSVDSKIPFFMPRTLKKVQIITDLATFRMGWVYQRSRMLYWKFMFKRSTRIADKIIAISEFTKKEITDILHIDPGKIEVIYCAAGDDYNKVEDSSTREKIREKYSLTGKFILYVGNFNPRKNLEKIIRAFDLLKKECSIEHKLVIVGEKGWKFDKEKAMEGISSYRDIYFTNYVENKDLAVIYSIADLFVFTTLYEGFGIPLIEAQKCGAPVLTSDLPCFREVAGNGAIYADPYNEENICGGMRKILTDEALRQQLISEGKKNASRFSWEQSAHKLYQVIEKVYNN